jgi:dihydroorotate dehydrogenase (fumarate)
MDLSTKYLGLTLPHPIIVGASPLADDPDKARRLEDAGAAALVLRSLFEEQIEREQIAQFLHNRLERESVTEALAYYPPPERFVFGPEEYLEHVRRVKEAVAIPVVASLNGTAPGRWLDFPPLLERVGADAVELNLYHMPMDPTLSGQDVERAYLETVTEVRRSVHIPVAVKLTPFFSSIAHFVAGLERAGVDGVVLFNRFHQPDIDLDRQQIRYGRGLSTPAELPLRLRWLAALSGRTRLSLALSGGVHFSRDIVKGLMAGADVVQVVSAVMECGVSYLRALREGLEHWMEQGRHTSLRELRGCMNLIGCPAPEEYERGNYMIALQPTSGVMGSRS